MSPSISVLIWRAGGVPNYQSMGQIHVGQYAMEPSYAGQDFVLNLLIAVIIRRHANQILAPQERQERTIERHCAVAGVDALR
jgi:hypothetical protein